MFDWSLVVLGGVVAVLLPFYVYLLNKFATVGRLSGERSFLRHIRRQKENCDG